MKLAAAAQLLALLAAQIKAAVEANKQDIDVATLGDEHRKAIKELRDYLDRVETR